MWKSAGTIFPFSCCPLVFLCLMKVWTSTPLIEGVWVVRAWQPMNASDANRGNNSRYSESVMTIKRFCLSKQAPRAQKLKKINLAWNFQSRLKCSISLENFNPDLQNSQQRKGFGGWFAWNFQSRLKISRSWIFSILGLLGRGRVFRLCRTPRISEQGLRPQTVSPYPLNLGGWRFTP